jgi:hypothetical protein
VVSVASLSAAADFVRRLAAVVPRVHVLVGNHDMHLRHRCAYCCLCRPPSITAADGTFVRRLAAVVPRVHVLVGNHDMHLRHRCVACVLLPPISHQLTARQP